jgi:streptogramin lyase
MRSTSMLKLVLAALAVVALAPAGAAAAPAVDRAFDLSGRPKHLALGPDGNIWITLEGSTDDVAQVTPDGTVTGFDSIAITNPIGIVAGPDGQLWVTQFGGVAHFSPSDPRAARLVPIADITTAGTIVNGPLGALWTASGDQVVRIGSDERSRAFRVDTMGARGIAAGGDGQLYVADFANRRVVGLTSDGATATFYPVDDAPQEVAAGPGGQIAATLPSNLIGRFTPPGRTVQNAQVPGTDPFGITVGEDGAYWVASFARDTLTRMATDGTVTTLSGFPRTSGPRYLTTGRDGTLWVGLETTSQVARVTGVVAPPPPPPPGGGGGGGGAPPPPVDRTAPTLTNVTFPATLRVGRAGTLRVTLSEAATVSARFERKLPGRRKAGRCVPPRRAPHARRCTRFVTLGTQRRAAVAGANRLAIGGKLGRRALPAGSYRVTILATDAAGNASAPVIRQLRVVPPPRRAAARRP